jgi:hypothetical protein
MNLILNMPGQHIYKKDELKLNYRQSKISRDILNEILKVHNYKYFKKNSLMLINVINQQLVLQKELPIYTSSKLNAWVSNKKYQNNCILKQKKLKQKELEQKELEQKELKKFDVDFKLINEILRSKELQKELPFFKNNY